MAYKDKADQKWAAAQHYQRNKAKVKKRAVEQKIIDREKARAYVLDFLNKNSCVDCAESDPVVLEFDHVRGKKLHNISDMVRNAATIRRIIAEIKKCEVRCANCHRRITVKRRKETYGEEIKPDSIQLTIFD